MQTVNYAKVADRYDNNKIRHKIPRDLAIERIAAEKPKVLDLGCGTGIYLQKQRNEFADFNITWTGLDASNEMLSIARYKNPDVQFVHATAEKIPFNDESFDYVVCRFAFHHFIDKKRALNEIHRVLRPGGYFRVENIAPDQSPHWWLYHYFPIAKAIDGQRFWTVEEIERAVLAIGFKYEISLDPSPMVLFDLLLEEARNRETSQLVLISDDEYQKGLDLIEQDGIEKLSKAVDSGLTLLNLICQKGS